MQRAYAAVDEDFTGKDDLIGAKYSKQRRPRRGARCWELSCPPVSEVLEEKIKERTREARTVTIDPSICQDGTDKGLQGGGQEAIAPELTELLWRRANVVWWSTNGFAVRCLLAHRFWSYQLLPSTASVQFVNLFDCNFGLNDFVVLFCFYSVSSNCGLWYADCRTLCPGPSSQDRTLSARREKKPLTFSTKFFRTDLHQWIPGKPRLEARALDTLVGTASAAVPQTDCSLAGLLHGWMFPLSERSPFCCSWSMSITVK